MTTLTRHGGKCCGASHLYGMSDSCACLDKVRNSTRAAKNKGHMLECVLTNQQMMRSPRLVALLKELGWKRTATWYNRNSGNYCNQFVYHRSPQRWGVIPF